MSSLEASLQTSTAGFEEIIENLRNKIKGLESGKIKSLEHELEESEEARRLLKEELDEVTNQMTSLEE